MKDCLFVLVCWFSMIQETLIRIAFFTYCWSLCHDISIKALECLLSLISYDYYGPRGETCLCILADDDLDDVVVITFVLRRVTGIKEHLDALKAEAATDKSKYCWVKSQF